MPSASASPAFVPVTRKEIAESLPVDAIVTFEAMAGAGPPTITSCPLSTTPASAEIASGSVTTVVNVPSTPAVTVPAEAPSAVMLAIVKNEPSVIDVPAFEPVSTSVSAVDTKPAITVPATVPVEVILVTVKYSPKLVAAEALAPTKSSLIETPDASVPTMLNVTVESSPDDVIVTFWAWESTTAPPKAKSPVRLSGLLSPTAASPEMPSISLTPVVPTTVKETAESFPEEVIVTF